MTKGRRRLSSSFLPPARLRVGIAVVTAALAAVIGINIYSHRAMEQVLRGFNTAYNARRQRVLNGKTPN